MAAAAIINTFAAFPAFADPDDPIPIVEDDEPEQSGDDSPIPIQIEDDDEPGDIGIPDGDDGDEEFNINTEAEEPAVSVTTAAPTETTTAAPAATTTAATAAPSYTSVSQQKLYATGSINVRSGPGTNYNIIGSVANGKEITVIGKSGDWYAISIYGTTAYVMAMYFTATPPTTTAATQGTTAAPTQSATLPPQTAVVEDTTTAPATEETTTEPAAEITTTKAEDDNNDKPAVTTKAPETTKETEAAAAASTDTDNKSGGSGIKGLLIAIGCGIGTFLLLGVVPVVAHSIYHKKLYQY